MELFGATATTRWRAVVQTQARSGGRWLAPGFLDQCKRRSPRSVSEEPPDFTNSRQADYASEWAMQNEAPVALFAMRRDDRRLLVFDPRDVRRPVGMLRHALKRWADENPSIQAHCGADRIGRLLFGHRSASAAEPSEGGISRSFLCLT